MRIVESIKIIVLNLCTLITNLFIWRSKKVWIFGSWMGVKFADNSRFLFQYLSAHKEQYGIKKVIWITDDSSVLADVRGLGYEALLRQSVKGLFYHFRAGVHVICNMPFDNLPYRGDINGNLSFGATKIQCWHGIPIKANTKGGKKNSTIRRIVQNVADPGGWKKRQVFLSTGRECTNRYRNWFGDKIKSLEVGYPRYCKCEKLLSPEKEMIETIGRYSGSILYVPTFRKNGFHFNHPLCNKSLCEWLEKNNIVWIEKPHQASVSDSFWGRYSLNPHNYVCLDSSFDINTILPIVSVVATDYSSVSIDAVYFSKPVISYVPDFEQYSTKDRGFISMSGETLVGEVACDNDLCFEKIKLVFEKDYLNNSSIRVLYSNLKEEMFNNSRFTNETICKQILSYINLM